MVKRKRGMFFKGEPFGFCRVVASLCRCGGLLINNSYKSDGNDRPPGIASRL